MTAFRTGWVSGFLPFSTAMISMMVVGKRAWHASLLLVAGW